MAQTHRKNLSFIKFFVPITLFKYNSDINQSWRLPTKQIRTQMSYRHNTIKIRVTGYMIPSKTLIRSNILFLLFIKSTFDFLINFIVSKLYEITKISLANLNR